MGQRHGSGRCLLLVFCGLLIGRRGDAAGGTFRYQPLGAQTQAPDAREGYPRWGFELRVGPYRPRLSSDPRIGRLYDAIYAGKHNTSLVNGRPLLYALEVDWYPSRSLGLLGAYGRVGFWRTANKGLLCSPANACNIDTYQNSVQGNDSASMQTVPVSVGAIFRWDGLRRLLNIPVLATVKGGVDYWIWWGNQGKGTARYHLPGSNAADLGQPAQGATLGLSGSAQLSVGLERLFSRQVEAYGSGRRAQLPYIFIEYQQIMGRHLLKAPSRHLDMTPVGHWMALVGLAVDSR